MLKKENRLTSRRAFSATYQNNNTVGNNLIVIYTGKFKTDKNCPTKVGFVVSKKVHKRAVIRNRIKRLMRETVRQLFKNNEYNIINNYQSLILIAKNNAVGKNFSEIRYTILTLLDKIANKNL